MHPANIEALRTAHVAYASLANNHTLDFCEEGLLETVRTLKRAAISFAGAGETREEATRPAVLSLPSHSGQGSGQPSYALHIYSASDHPRDWTTVANFHLIDYSAATRAHLKSLLTEQGELPSPALKVFSVHWGPNYSWQPSNEIQSLAHFLVDECAVDVVHGHSSHHVQGVERYRGKLIIYGCGDFVDDYAVKQDYRNDLGATWRVTVREGKSNIDDGRERLSLHTLEVFPTRIKHFQANLLDVRDADHAWVRDKVTQLSGALGTPVQEELGDQGQLIVAL